MNTGKGPPKNNFPADRTATRVAVMTVNPYLLHVYWQICGQDLEHVQGTLGESPADARTVLRFYDITRIVFDGTNAHGIFDVEVDLRTMKWDVAIWSADKSYVIDLGYKTSGGRFYQIARSNTVHVPRAEPSPRIAERYLRVERGQIKSLAPEPIAHTPVRNPIEAPPVEIMEGMEKDTGAPLGQEADRVKAMDFDLVHLTEEIFTFGVSSPTPAPGTNS